MAETTVSTACRPRDVVPRERATRPPVALPLRPIQVRKGVILMERATANPESLKVIGIKDAGSRGVSPFPFVVRDREDGDLRRIVSGVTVEAVVTIGGVELAVAAVAACWLPLQEVQGAIRHATDATIAQTGVRITLDAHEAILAHVLVEGVPSVETDAEVRPCRRRQGP